MKSYLVNNKATNSSYLDNEMNELISDKGITYNKTINNTQNSDITRQFSNWGDQSNDELFEKFKEFIEFKKMIESGLL